MNLDHQSSAHLDPQSLRSLNSSEIDSIEGAKKLPKQQIPPPIQEQQTQDSLEDIMENLQGLLLNIKAETRVINENEKLKLEKRIDQALELLPQLRNFLTKEKDPIENLPIAQLNKIQSDSEDFISFLKSPVKRKNDSLDLLSDIKGKIDQELKTELSDITNIITNIEQIQEEGEQQNLDFSKRKTLTKELDNKLKVYSTLSHIVDLSNSIDTINSFQFNQDDCKKFAYIEEKLNESRLSEKKELYISDIYPSENDLHGAERPQTTSNILEEEKELPSMRIHRSNSNESLLSGLSDFKTLHLENYEVSISDKMEFNSILQTNLLKSLDGLTMFQTHCLKKGLDTELTKEEDQQNQLILKKLKRTTFFPKGETLSQIEFASAKEQALHSILIALSTVFQKELNLEVVISQKAQDSDLSKFSYLQMGETKIYRFTITKCDFQDIIAHPVTFEKFTTELKFFMSSGLKIDPNLIRLIRLKENEGNLLVDLDIRSLNLNLKALEDQESAIQKRFGTVTYQVYDYLKKFSISVHDFDFDYNNSYDMYYPNPLSRGNYPYYLPGPGWKRIALNVIDKYNKEPPFGENWIKNGKDSWAVFFHGIRYDGVEKPLKGIITGGFSRGWANYHNDKDFQLDVSINSPRVDRDCVDDPNVVRVFMTEKLIDGVDNTYEEIGVETHPDQPWLIPKIAHYNYLRPHKIVIGEQTQYTMVAFQCRVNPSAIRIPNLQRDYVIINGPENVRAYGIMVKIVSQAYYESWNKKYDFMGRYFQTDDIIYKKYYEVLEKGLQIPMVEDFSILGHKDKWNRNAEFSKFSFIKQRGQKIYYRPTLGWIRIGLNVEKLFPDIDWRSRLTRGQRVESEWAVGYMIFDVSIPTCYKELEDYINIYEEFRLAEGEAESFKCENLEYKILIQVRFNSRAKRVKIPKEEFAKGVRFNLRREFVLPYGLLLKERSKKHLEEKLEKIQEEGEEDLVKRLEEQHRNKN